MKQARAFSKDRWQWAPLINELQLVDLLKVYSKHPATAVQERSHEVVQELESAVADDAQASAPALRRPHGQQHLPSVSFPIALLKALKALYRSARRPVATVLLGKRLVGGSGSTGSYVVSKALHMTAVMSDQYGLVVDNLAVLPSMLQTDEVVLGLAMARPIAPLPLASDTTALEAVRDTASNKTACCLLLLLDDAGHRFLTPSGESRHDIGSEGWSPCSFLQFPDDGYSPDHYAVTVMGGYTIAPAEQMLDLSCLQFVANVHSKSIRAAMPRAGHKMDMDHVVQGLVGASLSVYGDQWPCSVVVYYTSKSGSAAADVSLPGASPHTWLIPVHAESHWALLAIRKPSGIRCTWEIILVDSKLGRPMLLAATQAAMQVANIFVTHGMPETIPASLTCARAPDQPDAWSCGPRADAFAKQILMLPLETAVPDGCFHEVNESQ